jgi:hypothetical protein
MHQRSMQVDGENIVKIRFNSALPIDEELFATQPSENDLFLKLYDDS